MDYGKWISQYHTLESVCVAITNADKHSTALAAAYAIDALEESREEVSKEGIEAHLEVLFDNGAVFDFDRATELALSSGMR